MTDHDFENKVTTAFVDFLNERDKTLYQFDCRPDEVQWHGPRPKPKLPDFKFIDKSSDCTLLIELSRFIEMDLDNYKKINRSFSTVKHQLEGNISGSYLLTIDNDRLSMPNKRGGKQNAYFNNVITEIKNIAQNMSTGASHEVKPGVLLRKYSDANSKILIQSNLVFKNEYEEQKYMTGVLKEANTKFKNIWAEPCKSILIILDTSTIWDRLSFLISLLKSGLYDENVDFTYISEIYEIDFNTDWDIIHIGISKCYPESEPESESESQYWHLHSELFENQQEYRDTFFRYFEGFK